MKYVRQTFSYLRKNFLIPIAVMIIPSVAACLLSTPYWEVSFVTAFADETHVPISQTFRILFGDSWQYLWPVLVVGILQAVSASLLMSAIDKHFRTGKLSLRAPTRLLNYSIGPIAIGILVMSAISILWRFILFGMVSLTQVLASAAHMNQGATLTFICVVAIVLFVVHVLIITPILYWAPIMFIYGYKLRDAAALSFRLIAGKKMFSGLLVPMLPCVGIALLIGFLNVHPAVGRIVNGFIFLFTNVYVVMYVILTFYRISDLDRRDIPIMQKYPLPTAKQIANESKTPQKIGGDNAETAAVEQKRSKKKRTTNAKQPNRRKVQSEENATKPDRRARNAASYKSIKHGSAEKSDETGSDPINAEAIETDDTGKGGDHVV